jgi:hypothetical protein
MIKEIKGTDKVSDLPILLNANLKELDERLKEVEKKLKIKRASKH